MILFSIIMVALPLLIVALLWYNPTARHITLAEGQVWKDSNGYTLTILKVERLPLKSPEKLFHPDNRKSVDFVMTLPQGSAENHYGYPGEAFRRLIVRNRYRLVNK